MRKINPLYITSKGKWNFFFHTPNPLTRLRGETLFTKEPETINWIDNFDSNSIMYDIGANVGVYTIYAGVTKPDLKIFAFEPTFFNYGLLNKNIYLNKLSEHVSALCLALSDKNLIGYIYMPEIQDGGTW